MKVIIIITIGNNITNYTLWIFGRVIFLVTGQNPSGKNPSRQNFYRQNPRFLPQKIKQSQSYK